MDDFQQSLLCTENNSDPEDAIFEIKNHHDGVVGAVSDENDDEYVEMLLDRELNFGFKRDESLVYCDWIKHARLETIDWILKKRAAFGYHIQTAYLSMTYFDRFLSERSINSDKLWATRLLSVACLSLAAKMEEIKLPSLSEFRVGDCDFENNVIQKMELLVLDTLHWRMASIAPFDFLPYVARKLFKDCPSSGMMSSTLLHILAIMKETNCTNYRPSSVAAAATLAVLEQKLTREELQSKLNIFHNTCLDIDDVFSCYNLLQNLEKKELITPNILHSPDMSTASIELIGSDVHNKRRRLTFNEHDQDNNSTEKRGSLR